MFDKLFFILRLVGYIFSLTSQRLSLILSAKFHRLTYRSVPKPQDIVVIGGSFAGYFLARQLSESLPTGYRVVLIEKHSHFHFTWNFPRVTVLQGHEQNAFIPYPSKPQDAPEGAFLFRKGNVISIDADSVTLENGESIKYEYLVIATGSQKRYPATLDADEKVDGVKFFAKQQQAIKSAQKIVVVGGGAAGVEVAGDVKSKYPEKDVTLVHSREHLLNSFGEGLHTKVNPAFEELGIHLHLGQRVVSGLGQEGPGELTLKNGKTLPFDLLIRCTGQTPNSTPFQAFSPSSVSPTGAIKVTPTHQIVNCPSPKIFALGDVTDIPGPKLGRAATIQAFLVAENIVRAIRGRKLKEYKASLVDHSIELTLGMGKSVTYISDGKNEIILSQKIKEDDLHAAQVWAMLDATPFTDPGYSGEDGDVDGLKGPLEDGKVGLIQERI